MQNPLLVIVGPTASGKTGLAVECALALNGEVVSADSMQIYKGMSIATAKPSKDEMQGVPHHLVDFLDVTESYSVADFVRDANKEIDEIYSKNRLPILAGGTGLYVDSLVNNLQFTEEKTDEALRQSLNEKLERIGAEKMLEELSRFDPEAASRLHPNNKKRIIRAFEVYISTGKTLTQAQYEATLQDSRFDALFIGINYKNRETLYNRIDRRIDLMLEQGLEEEAREYYYSLPQKATASQAIGYKELKPYFDGEISLDEAVDNLKLATRHYAKRQLTWFRKNEKINWFYPDGYTSSEEFYGSVIKFIKEAMK
jgi:tRNA dimethylallyltransferase